MELVIDMATTAVAYQSGIVSCDGVLLFGQNPHSNFAALSG